MEVVQQTTFILKTDNFFRPKKRLLQKNNRVVVQLVRTLVLGTRGRQFESGLPDKKCKKRLEIVCKTRLRYIKPLYDTLKQDRPNGRKLDLNGTVLKLEDFNGD